MMTTTTRRDSIEQHLGRCVEQHEQMREVLRLIDRAGPGMQRLTLAVRERLTTLATIYNAIRVELTVDAMVQGGEFDAPSGQRPVAELELFCGLVRGEAGIEAGTRKRFLQSLHAAGDHTLDDDQDGLSEVPQIQEGPQISFSEALTSEDEGRGA